MDDSCNQYCILLFMPLYGPGSIISIYAYSISILLVILSLCACFCPSRENGRDRWREEGNPQDILILSFVSIIFNQDRRIDDQMNGYHLPSLSPLSTPPPPILSLSLLSQEKLSPSRGKYREENEKRIYEKREMKRELDRERRGKERESCVRNRK